MNSFRPQNRGQVEFVSSNKIYFEPFLLDKKWARNRRLLWHFLLCFKPSLTKVAMGRCYEKPWQDFQSKWQIGEKLTSHFYFPELRRGSLEVHSFQSQLQKTREQGLFSKLVATECFFKLVNSYRMKLGHMLPTGQRCWPIIFSTFSLNVVTKYLSGCPVVIKLPWNEPEDVTKWLSITAKWSKIGPNVVTKLSLSCQ